MTPEPSIRMLNKSCPHCNGPIVAKVGRSWHCADHPEHDISEAMPPICQECGEFMTPVMAQVPTDAGPIERPTGFVVCPNGHKNQARFMAIRDPSWTYDHMAQRITEEFGVPESALSMERDSDVTVSFLGEDSVFTLRFTYGNTEPTVVRQQFSPQVIDHFREHGLPQDPEPDDSEEDSEEVD